MIRKFARPYARAIIQSAESTEVAQSLYDELARFEKVRCSSDELVEVFANPGFDLNSKIRVAGEIAKKTESSDLGGRIIEVLVRNHRINQLDAILAALRAEINERLGRTVALVRSADVLTEKQALELQQALEKKTGRRVELEITRDETLLGGFVAQLGSEVYDASVIGQINRLRDILP